MRVVVLGAGYAGLSLTRRLERSLPDEVELVIVNESPTHLIQHEIHRVIRRPEFAEELLVDLDEVLNRAHILVDRVQRVSPEENTVTLTDETVDYDYAAVCLGAAPAYHGVPGVEEHSIPVKRIEHVNRIRDRFLEIIDHQGRTVVGGAGLSGVQVAGELADLRTEEGGGEDVDIVLLEQLDDVAPGFPSQFRQTIRRELLKRGVDIRTNTTVTEATDSHVVVNGDNLPFDQFVWTGGIRGTSPLEDSRPQVNSTLRFTDRSFILGDAARVVDKNGAGVPASAQAATREARTAAKNITKLVKHDRSGGVFEPRLTRFTFDSTRWIVSVGDEAVALVGPSVVTGHAAHTLKATAGIGYLTSIGAVREAVALVREEFAP